MKMKAGFVALATASLVAPVLATLGAPGACIELTITLPGKVAYPTTPTYNAYNNYWSARQDELSPLCFVAPTSTADVVKVMKALRRQKAPFTVKSGGHLPFPGSNIQGGVTVTLEKMASLSLSQDESTLSAGPGNRWRALAEFLDPKGLAVVGGRVGDIGVSGLTLGGGISWFSGRYGWACDNVKNFEVVLASGSVVNANTNENADLYKALRGGGGPNFGIVTRFDFDTIEQGDVWYKEALYPPPATNDAIQAFSDLTVDGLAEDVDAHPVMFAAYQPSLGGVVTQIFRWHSTPPSDIHSEPEVFEVLANLPELQPKNATLPVAEMLDVYPEPYGFRKGWWDTSVRASAADVMQDIVAEYGTWAAANFADKPDVVAVLLCLPLPVSTMQQMQKNGGNSLGLDPADGAQIKITTYVTWTDPDMDDFIAQKAGELVAASEQIAQDGGAFIRGFRYINNADPTQEVYERYGAASLAELEAAAEKFDPDEVLKKQWKGFFKL